MKTTNKQKSLLKCINVATNALFDAADGLTTLARYLHYYKVAHLEFKPRFDDIFIVTYPRSGTTWLQMILYQLATDGNMEIDHIAQKVPWFERLIDYRIWDSKDFEQMNSPRLFKSHLPANEVPKGGCKYIYVARNGSDVALSYFEFYRSHLGFKGDFNQFFKLFISGRVQFGSWFDHVASWEKMSKKLPSQVLFLTFEDLKNDFNNQLNKIINFTGFKILESQRADVIERCSFRFMKQHEDKFDHITAQIWEKGYQRSSFIREGKAGLGKLKLTPEQHSIVQKMLKQFHIENL
ncbi:MAG: sulfotransferase domain-containing protein [Desulfamplus sp.]|nr:sulfotransferase domain-containing protein [Desulfamplus sp.]MBF0389751.1 sulfotransferase domain-containing protein [Desulfamplus sp.]